MSIIIPAILTKDINILRSQLENAAQFADRVQIDFALAPFIDPSSTVRPSELPRMNFPGILEAHLMIKEPQEHFSDVRRIGFDYVYVHWEAIEDPLYVIRSARGNGLKIGLAINPDTKWKKIKKGILREFDAVLFMTVIPGKQGNTFQKKVLRTIREFLLKENMPVAVDGGINEENIKKVVEAGVQLIAVGSCIWQSKEGPEKAYKRLQSRISKYEIRNKSEIQN